MHGFYWHPSSVLGCGRPSCCRWGQTLHLPHARSDVVRESGQRLSHLLLKVDAGNRNCCEHEVAQLCSLPGGKLALLPVLLSFGSKLLNVWEHTLPATNKLPTTTPRRRPPRPAPPGPPPPAGGGDTPRPRLSSEFDLAGQGFRIQVSKKAHKLTSGVVFAILSRMLTIRIRASSCSLQAGDGSTGRFAGPPSTGRS